MLLLSLFSIAVLINASAWAMDNLLGERITQLDSQSSLTFVSEKRFSWPTFHTQGMYKVGDKFYVSSVEIIEKTERYPAQEKLQYGEFDRSPGKGKGWLFEFDLSGTLLRKVQLGEGNMYHPGGIDFDGRYFWIPVAEYRPNSRSLLYKVDIKSFLPEIITSVPDHIGGLVYRPQTNTLYGMSWGSRDFYAWPLPSIENQNLVVSDVAHTNPLFNIDYQDCQYVIENAMLCAGLKKFNTPTGTVSVGGLSLLSLDDFSIQRHLPISEYIQESGVLSSELVLTNNAFFAEVAADDKLHLYFMTETNNQARLLHYIYN